MIKFKGAIISIITLIVLIGGYFLIKNIKIPDKKNTTDVAVDDETSDFNDVFTVNYEDIIYYSVNNSHGSYSFELNNQVWKCVEDASIDLNQQVVFNNIVSASYYDAYTIKEGEYDPSEFGLDTPTMTVTLKLVDGSLHTMKYGNQAPTDDFLYYVTIDDKPVVYAVLGTKYDILNVPLGAFRDTTFFALDYNGLKKITIGGKDKQIIEIKENSSQNEMSLSNWLMTTPYYKSVSDLTLGDLIIAPLAEESIPIISYVEDRPSSLAKYGLDNPKNYVTFTYSDKSLTIKLGNYDDKGNVYAMRSDSNVVYTIDYTKFTFFEYSAFEYIDKSIYFALITDLKSLTITSNGTKYDISIPSNGTDYKINGKKTTEEKVKTFYGELALCSVDGVVNQQISGAPEVTITYNYISGKQAKIEFIPYNNRSYAMKVDGRKADFYINKSDISALVSKIAEL